MPQQTKIFRVFVSSTFSDMKEERRILQKNVFPRLEKLCESKGARFQGVDLRWGINENLQMEQKTIDVCLNEIARCQNLSPKPNFLILLGDRYGWQPVPTRIPDKEMQQILGTLKDPERVFLETTWYKLDENAVPTEWILQPRAEELKEYVKWEKVEEEIRNLLRKSVDSLDFTPAQREKYFCSATHLEITNGALNPPQGMENSEEHVFAFVRTIEGLPHDENAKDYLDFKNGSPDGYSKEMLDSLKKELEIKLGKNFIRYGAEWKNDTSSMKSPKDFEERIYKELETIILEQISATITTDEIQQEVNLHNDLRARLVKYFDGRAEILEQIAGYVSKGDEKVLSLIGDSGSGKSSVLAKAIDNCKSKNGNALVIYRFIGATSSSCNIISLLQSVCGQIANHFNITVESLAGEGREKALYEINGITEVFRKCIAMGTEEKPIILFLDALDQLSDSDNAKALYWIPRQIPQFTRFIVSATPEYEGKLGSTSINHLPLLPVEDARTILDRWLEAINRKLMTEQKHNVLEQFENTKLPIFLKIAFEISRRWRSYEGIPAIKNDISGIINDFIDGLEKEHTLEFVEHAICYMLSGRYQGLTETEILEILAYDEEYWKIFLGQSHHREELEEFKAELSAEGSQEKGFMKIPIVVWSRFFFDLEPFLTERDADGIPIITFFHRQFNDVLRKRYGLHEEEAENGAD